MTDRRFLITGTQSSSQSSFGARHVCIVEALDLRCHWLRNFGPTRPSSESLTHATLYALDEGIRFVFHVHCRAIWRNAERLGVPSTPARVPYGSSEMVTVIRALYTSGALDKQQILSMAGHQDGVLAFVPSAERAGGLVNGYLARALEINPPAAG